jgi:hypothetical protein
MGKAGSTAIQHWMLRNADTLAEHGYTLVVARAGDAPELLRVEPHTGGAASSGRALGPLLRGETRAEAVEVLATSLRRLAESHGRIVISAEALASLFSSRDAPSLPRFEELAGACEVRVAYYARPQHTALEAAWRQWGFRTGLPPSRYIDGQAGQLHHLGTLRRVAEGAPSVDFRLRPFRRDLLVGGDVVKDFAEQVLGIDRARVRGATGGNPGTPLVVANLLATAPDGLLWDSVHDNGRFNRLKRILDDDAADGRQLRALVEAIGDGDDSTERGRAVLQRWARRRFEDDNRTLFELAGWPPTEWIPDCGDGDEGLEALDELWSPTASAAELALLHLLLESATRSSPGRRRREGGPARGG